MSTDNEETPINKEIEHFIKVRQQKKSMIL